LERSARISKDLEWFKEQGIAIPEPSPLGSTYATYLTELADSNAPAFLSHYYNIYFAHITGGVAVGNKVTHSSHPIKSPLPLLFDFSVHDIANTLKYTYCSYTFLI
jgi:hypothetical protein